MIEATSNDYARQRFALHLKQTEERAKKRWRSGKPGPVLDAPLIASAQRIEQYEMAGYGTARTFAKPVGDDESIPLLEKTLNAEKQTDEKLTQIADVLVNPKAAAA